MARITETLSKLFGKRSFTLPQSVDTGKITATHNNGVLTITIAKREEAKVKPAKQIEIR